MRGSSVREIVDHEDVRMVERARGPRFLLEAVESAAVGACGGWQHLHRDIAAESLIVGAVDDAHPPGADSCGNSVVG